MQECVCTPACVCTFVWKPDGSLGCRCDYRCVCGGDNHMWNVETRKQCWWCSLLPETGDLGLLIRRGWLASVVQVFSVSASPSLELQACATMSGFSVGSRELTEVLMFVPRACLTSALSTKLSFQL